MDKPLVTVQNSFEIKYRRRECANRQPKNYSMGSRAESIFSSLGLGEEEVGVYNAVKQAFEEYFSPRRYTIYERAKFFRRVQAEGESVEQFIRALNQSAANHI